MPCMLRFGLSYRASDSLSLGLSSFLVIFSTPARLLLYLVIVFLDYDWPALTHTYSSMTD